MAPVDSGPNGLHPHHDNIICLPRQPGDALPPVPSLAEGVVFMSTYEEFMIILTTVNVIIAILTYLHKK